MLSSTNGTNTRSTVPHVVFLWVNRSRSLAWALAPVRTVNYLSARVLVLAICKPAWMSHDKCRKLRINFVPKDQC